MTCVDSPKTAAWDDLIQLALHVRPTDAPAWHSPGIKAAIRHELDSDREFTFAEMVAAVVSAAMNRDARTPAVIGHTASWPIKPNTAAKVHAWHEGDPRFICGVCDLTRDACMARSATNGHTFVPRTDCLPPTDRTTGWMTRRATKCLQGPPNAQCQLENGHDGQHEGPTAPTPEPQGLTALAQRRPELAQAADAVAAAWAGVRGEAAAAAGEVTG